MKVVVPGKLISAHTLSRAALAGQKLPQGRCHQMCVCTQQIRAHWASSHCHWLLFQQSPLRLSDGTVSLTVAIRVPAAICKAHGSAHTVSSEVWATPLSSAVNFYCQGFPWAFPFLSFQIDFSFFFKWKGNCLLPVSANNPQWATEHPRLSGPIVSLLQILWSWLKQNYIKIGNLAYACKRGIFNHRYTLKS